MARSKRRWKPPRRWMSTGRARVRSKGKLPSMRPAKTKMKSQVARREE